MKRLLDLPLHYQILIALAIGTVVGVLANPGESELDDARGEVRKSKGKIVVVEKDGDEILSQTFDSDDAFRNRYKKLADAFFAEGRDEQPLSFKVTAGIAHVIEQPKKISIGYTRVWSGDGWKQKVVNTITADEAGKLSQHWRKVYESEYADSHPVSRRLTIASKWVGDLFLRLLKMITVPLIITSLVTGVAGLGNTSRFGAMFGRTIGYYLVTSVLAIATGILMVNIIQPGKGVDLPGGEGAKAGGDQSLGGVFGGLIENMFPTNPIAAVAAGEFLSIIAFSILFGIFIIYTGGTAAERMRGFFESAFEVMMNFTLFIIRLAPIGVLAFMTYATITQGLDIFRTLFGYMLAVFLALVVHACIVLPLIVKFVARRSPVEYFKAMSPALMTAFSTASSNGTLPLTMSCVEDRAGVSNRVSSFVLPLGATINMDGTALYEAVAVLFIAQATTGFEMTLGTQIVIAFTALLASIGAAGIPHAGLVMMAIVLQAVGLPLEAQGVIIAVDRILDMCRTSVNVWSDSCGCAVIARFDSEPDDEAS